MKGPGCFLLRLEPCKYTVSQVIHGPCILKKRIFLPDGMSRSGMRTLWRDLEAILAAFRHLYVREVPLNVPREMRLRICRVEKCFR